MWDIYYYIKDRGYFNLEISSDEFAPEASVAYDSSTGFLNVNYVLHDEYDNPVDLSKVLNMGTENFEIEYTTDLVNGRWFYVNDGFRYINTT